MPWRALYRCLACYGPTDTYNRTALQRLWQFDDQSDGRQLGPLQLCRQRLAGFSWTINGTHSTYCDINIDGALTDGGWTNTKIRGVMGANASVAFSQIRDGSSNTVLLAEIRAGRHIVRLTRRFGPWPADVPIAFGRTATSATIMAPTVPRHRWPTTSWLAPTFKRPWAASPLCRKWACPAPRAIGRTISKPPEACTRAASTPVSPTGSIHLAQRFYRSQLESQLHIRLGPPHALLRRPAHRYQRILTSSAKAPPIRLRLCKKHLVFSGHSLHTFGTSGGLIMFCSLPILTFASRRNRLCLPPTTGRAWLRWKRVFWCNPSGVFLFGPHFRAESNRPFHLPAGEAPRCHSFLGLLPDPMQKQRRKARSAAPCVLSPSKIVACSP